MNNKTDLKSLGLRLKKAREETKLTQYQLYEKTGISTTQISAFENGKKQIGLSSLYRIAQATNRTMDELYIGSINERPITSAINEGELIINCVTALFDSDVIKANIKIEKEEPLFRNNNTYYKVGFSKYIDIINGTLLKLADFKINKDSYPDPDDFKKQILASAAKQINDSNVSN